MLSCWSSGNVKFQYIPPPPRRACNSEIIDLLEGSWMNDLDKTNLIMIDLHEGLVLICLKKQYREYFNEYLE